MIKAVIFDMDGVLIDSEQLWYESAKQVLDGIGIKLTQADFNKVKGRGVKHAVEDWHHMHPWEKPSLQEVENRIIKKFLTLVKKQGKPMPGVYELLKELKSKELPLALASSSKYEIINTIVDMLDIRDYFDVIYSAEEETHSKPHPSVFISASKKLKVKPRYCLVFEDAPSGVLAAKAATMKCVAVPDREQKFHPFIQTADIVLQSLEQFDDAMLDKLGK